MNLSERPFIEERETKSSLLCKCHILAERLIEAEEFVKQVKIGNGSKMYDVELLPIVELEIEEITEELWNLADRLEDFGWLS